MRVRPFAPGLDEATGMLLTAICPAGALIARSKVALKLGSSQEGMKRRASEFSNWVNNARRAPCAVV